ncbi:MAG: hypothetical protein FWB75_02280 [Oscillospiraceae bacterium]|nr:hypothetical protein [Oscillospiraceae bacterium]
MASDPRIYALIGIFMVACIALIVFNFAIVRYHKRQTAPAAGKLKMWNFELYKQTAIKGGSKSVIRGGMRPGTTSRHERLLLRKLPNAEHLIAYSEALQNVKDRQPMAYSSYMSTYSKTAVFHKLADVYSRKSCIERTCYADFIGSFPEAAELSQGQLADSLISYIDDSNIYCRTKVLRACCRIGSLQGVANVLQLFHDRSLFMHKQLLANELADFSGDQSLLGERLWDECKSWNDNISEAVVSLWGH